ncbi:MAG: hypothetical protein HY863_15630 [Chloroflexi bacterium]|nr:hypothetical protein [Chloroflexota bacterium]
MWQKKNKDDEEYHLLWDIDADLNGHEVKTACDESIVVNLKDQRSNPYFVPGCALCVPIWHLTCTSVHDAIGKLKHIDNLKVLRRAQELTKSVSLKKAFGARIRKIERNAEKERKLRLIQQAYD